MKKDRICITICSRGWSKNILKILNDLNKNINKKKLNISFILVFNHQYKIKRSEVNSLRKILKLNIFKIFYEKKLGVSNVRNKALKILKKINFDYCLFIDDDCSIKKNFLTNHLNFIKKSNTNIVTGPQIFKSKKNMYKIFERNFINGKNIAWASTNNVFFKKQILKHNIYFSPNVSKYGYGEDQLFFLKIRKAGERITWNNNPVFEIVKRDRSTLSWFIKRNFYYGLTGKLIDNEHYGVGSAYILNIFKAIYNFLLFFINFISFYVNPEQNLFKSLGFFMRFLGRIINIFKLF